MMRTICIHGHFYQPPRENPWTGRLDRQTSAAPYHDWNARIYAECYSPNAHAQLLDETGTLKRCLNNYDSISFDFGPTLLKWAETDAPELLDVLRESERKSAYYSNGQGNGVAQTYHHVILPLAPASDRELEIHWGIAEFEARFGRKPKGLWLPETGVDTASLEALVAAGIKFTILAPQQIAAFQAPSGTWTEVASESDIPTHRPYRVDLPSGHSISVFVYDGQVSHGIAFGGLLNDGERFANSILERFKVKLDEPQIIVVATDGESYGHHHRYGEMALARCLVELSKQEDVCVENCEAFLARWPPTWCARIVESSAWSCAHGVGRWQRDCGCAINPSNDWTQNWRGPLRESFEWLREAILNAVEQSGFEFSFGLQKAQIDYVNVILGSMSGKEFVTHHCPKAHEKESKLIQLMEMLRYARAMFTSCAWFFDDISGIEAGQNLLYARRAIEIAKQVLDVELEPGFLKRLREAKSNIPDSGDGETVYRRNVEYAQSNTEKHAKETKTQDASDSFMAQRSAGVLLHPTSLPNHVGGGTIGLEAYQFVDWLADCGFQWWQILPLVPPAPEGSPYNSWSAFSANPILISLSELQEAGLLKELPSQIENTGHVNFEALAGEKMPRLEAAADQLWAQTDHPWTEGLLQFRSQSEWLREAALFYAIKKQHDGQAWWTWPDGLRNRNAEDLALAETSLKHEIDRFVAIQYFFERQWASLRAYCAQKNVKIIGDIPIYVAHNSADVWAHQDLFLLGEDACPIEVSGAPPDAYSDVGQLWGNPIYRWDLMAKDDFRWWKRRIQRALDQVDVVRLDNFRGFSAYWSIPSGEETALNGQWISGPATAFFSALKRKWPSLPFVAEDLGLIDEDVHALRNQFDLPGMRVLQFGFDGNPHNIHAMHNCAENSLVYTGTHDTDTLLGWWLSESEWLKDQVRRYFAVDGHDLVWDMIRAVMASSGKIAIIQMQDILALDSEGRMNRPGIANGNWGWRLRDNAHTCHFHERIRELIEIYGRE